MSPCIVSFARGKLRLIFMRVFCPGSGHRPVLALNDGWVFFMFWVFFNKFLLRITLFAASMGISEGGDDSQGTIPCTGCYILGRIPALCPGGSKSKECFS